MNFERSLVHLTGKLRILIRQRLWLQVLIGMFAGIGVGILIGPSAAWVAPQTSLLIGNWLALPGKMFLLAIQFVVVPLVVASVIRGIAAHDADVSLRRMGGWTVAFFLITTLVAVAIGLLAAALVQPGAYIKGDALNAVMDAPDVAQGGHHPAGGDGGAQRRGLPVAVNQIHQDETRAEKLLGGGSVVTALTQ